MSYVVLCEKYEDISNLYVNIVTNHICLAGV